MNTATSINLPTSGGRANTQKLPQCGIWVVALFTMLIAALDSLADVTFTELFSFAPANSVTGMNSTGVAPSGLVQGADGNLYGVTHGEGPAPYGAGTLFKLTTNGVFTLLHTFAGSSIPGGTLANGIDGNIYGTVPDDGNGGGLVFKVRPGGAYSVVHTFDSSTEGTPASGVFGGLLQDSDGTIYGGGGAPSHSGSDIFSLQTNGTVTVLYVFSGPDGYEPSALVKGPDGNFYGTTAFGGQTWSPPDTLGYGTVFQVTPGGSLTTLISFTGTTGDFLGSFPTALVLSRDGNLCGTTGLGGTNLDDHGNACGSAFRIAQDGAFTNLVSFGPGNAYPGALVEGTDGGFYGTSKGWGAGSALDATTIFQMTPDGTVTTLFDLNAVYPGFLGPSGLIQAADGSLYGVLASGGTNGTGAIYRLTITPTPRILSSARLGSTFTLTLSGLPGRTYQVQFASDLVHNNWTNLGAPVALTNTTTEVSDAVGSDRQRFYRVGLLP